MIHETTNDFFIQKLKITNIRDWRFDYFCELASKKKVLHIGCDDAGAFNPVFNLHMHLFRCSDPLQLDGLDTDFEAVEKLRTYNEVLQLEGTDLDANIKAAEKLNKHQESKYYTDYKDVTETYDLVLIPEVIEHVPNINEFLKSVFSINSTEYFITAPSIYGAQIFCMDEYCLELVHPDHKCWFSPYTFFKSIKPFMDGYNVQMYYLENKSQVGIRLWKKEEVIEEPEEEKIE